MSKNNIADFVRDQAKNDFDILKKWSESAVKLPNNFENEMIELIAFQIKKMLNEDFNQLLELLYKVDINETKVKNVFGQDRAQIDIARDIARLYVERMIQKWHTRQQFKTEDEGDWD